MRRYNLTILMPTMAVAAIGLLATNPPLSASTQSSWVPSDGRVIAPKGWSGVEYFGHAIGASGAWLLVGAIATNDSTSTQDLVFVYHRSGSGWRQVQTLHANAGGLGSRIVMAGDTAFIGGYLTVAGSRDVRNVVFVYSVSQGHWRRTAVLAPNPGGGMVYNGKELFVGGRGAKVLYAFSKVDGAWKQTDRLDVGEGPIGSDVSAAGGRLIVLSYGPGGFLGGHGVIAVYERSHGKWTKSDSIARDKGLKGYRFVSCAISPTGNTIFAVAERDVPPSVLTPSMKEELAAKGLSPREKRAMVEKQTVQENAVLQRARNDRLLVYRKSHGEWQLAASVAPKKPELAASFGRSMGFLKGEVYVGAPRANIVENGYWNGAVYVFRGQGSDWVEVDKLTARHPDVAESFGASFARAGNTLFVGAPTAQVNGVDRGAVYEFVAGLSP